MAKSRQVSLSELRVGREASVEARVKPAAPLFTVASVELGNTTTKCILTSTNLETGKVYLVNKTVKLTEDMRGLRRGEEAFGSTLWGRPLSRESVAEFIRDITLRSLDTAGVNRDKDLNFVVRSTGVTASFATPEETGEMIKAMASGCIAAGISPSKMVAPLSKEFIPSEFQAYSNLDNAPFRGAVAGCYPPRTPNEIMANEMEAELSTAGIKLGAKWTDVDFRNPVMGLDFGTTFKGRITDDNIPYAQTVGSICGLAGAICDAVVQGTGKIPFALTADLQGLTAKNSGEDRKKVDWKLAEDMANEAHKYIKIERAPLNLKRYGTVPVNPDSAEKAGIFLMGCDVGRNGSDFPKLRRLGDEIYRNYGLAQLYAVLDCISAIIAYRVANLAMTEGLINKKTSIGITGRAGTTGMKPHLILKYIENLGLYSEKVDKKMVFVEDGLALGANVMARCMNGLGTPRSPLGGNRRMGCVLKYRIKGPTQTP